jgi:hypothetical protein
MSQPVGKLSAYAPPQLQALSPHDVIRKLMRELSGPLGATKAERVTAAASAMRNVLARLPAAERDEAVATLLDGNSRWILRSSWSP